VTPIVAVRADDRFPVPTELDQKDRKERIRRLYRVEYAARTQVGIGALASKLLSEGRKEGDSATRYVLLSQARVLGAKAGDLDTAKRAAYSLYSRFRVEALPLRVDTLSRISLRSWDTKLSWELAIANLALLETAVEEEEFDVADAAAKGASDAARRGKHLWLVQVGKDSQSHVKTLRREREGLEDAYKALLNDPDDADANLAVGRFYCFFKGSWRRGLLLLQRGADETLSGLAASDLSTPTDPSEQVRLGDGWLAQARKEKSPARDYVQIRALRWYEKAVPQLSLSARPVVAKVIADLSKGIQFHLPDAKRCYGLFFDGRNDNVRVSNLRYDAAQPLTVEAFVRPAVDESEWGAVIANSGETGLMFGLRNKWWTFSFFDGKEWRRVHSKQPIVAHQQTHIAGVFDGSQIRIYVNGRLEDRMKIRARSAGASPLDFRIGADPNSEDGVTREFEGEIDEVRISRTVRYRRNFKPRRYHPPDSDTMLLLHFDQGLGGSVLDSSQNGNSTTLRGADWVRSP
jgi:hypothetical protein